MFNIFIQLLKYKILLWPMFNFFPFYVISVYVFKSVPFFPLRFKKLAAARDIPAVEHITHM